MLYSMLPQYFSDDLAGILAGDVRLARGHPGDFFDDLFLDIGRQGALSQIGSLLEFALGGRNVQ